MRVIILYHPKSDHGGTVEDFAREYKRLRGRDVELISLETREGSDMAQTYDATFYPAVLAVDEGGQLMNLWQGNLLPTVNDVDSYFHE